MTDNRPTPIFAAILSGDYNHEVLHRVTCGHGQRALRGGRADLLVNATARIVRAACTSAIDPVRACRHCEPHTHPLALNTDTDYLDALMRGVHHED